MIIQLVLSDKHPMALIKFESQLHCIREAMRDNCHMPETSLLPLTHSRFRVQLHINRLQMPK